MCVINVGRPIGIRMVSRRMLYLMIVGATGKGFVGHIGVCLLGLSACAYVKIHLILV